jgi:membrane associated rhomboid family serine protease
MGSQCAVLLYSLLFVSGFGLVRTLKIPVAWSWPVLLQASLVLAIALLGIAVGPNWAFVVTGWTCFCVFFVIPRILFSQYDLAVSTLNSEKLASSARALRYFYWGKYGMFWQAMAHALVMCMKGEGEGAEELFSAWQQRNLPKYLRQNLETYRTTGEAIAWNWQGVVEHFEALRAAGESIPKTLVISASRAYAELGESEACARALEYADLPSARLSLRLLATAFLPLFCIFGARAHAEKLLAYLSKGINVLPPYSKHYWLGRLHYAEGNLEEAGRAFEQALTSSPRPSAAFKARIENLLELSKRGGGTSVVDRSQSVKSIWKIFESCAYVQSIVTPRDTSRVVSSIVLAILACYLVSDSYSFFPNELTAQLKLDAYNVGMLKPDRFMAGEYWRLITYLFLHAHVAHMLLNVLGLYWFGRIAENIFGAGGFLLIYFGSGLLGGMTHAFLAPHTLAIGASGAVMGVFGAVAAGIFRLKTVIPESLRRSELFWMLGLAGAQIVLDHVIPQIASFVHLGGLITGVVLGLLLKMPDRKPFMQTS